MRKCDKMKRKMLALSMIGLFLLTNLTFTETFAKGQPKTVNDEDKDYLIIIRGGAFLVISVISKNISNTKPAYVDLIMYFNYKDDFYDILRHFDDFCEEKTTSFRIDHKIPKVAKIDLNLKIYSVGPDNELILKGEITKTFYCYWKLFFVFGVYWV